MIKQLRHYLVSALTDDITDIAVIHEEYNALGYKNKEVFSTYDICI